MIEATTLEGHVRRPVPTVPWGMTGPPADIWPTRAQELLLRAALIGDERAGEAWREVRPLIDVATLDGSTMALLPLLGKNLSALGVEDELFGMFKGVHRYTWARAQSLLAPMLPIVEALERADIPTMLLKGGAFIADGRLDAGIRALNDLDVLVPTEQRGAAIAVLLAAGLVPVGDVPAWYVDSYAPRFIHSHGFRDELDRQLDLHWHAMNASCQRDADEDLWAAATPIELLGTSTRALCPADELLLVILHGLRWNAIPTYRWVVDAALLCGGSIGEIDYERLVAQARKRCVTVAVRAGVEYLRRVADSPIPPGALKALGAARPALLERAEFRAQTIQPRARSRIQYAIVHQRQYIRHELPLGARPGIAGNIAVARRRLGIRRLGDLRHIRAGGTPGPGRPASEMAAAVGTGSPDPAAPTVVLGEPIDLGRRDVVPPYTCYGTWLAEGEGCWIAGRRARLQLPLAEPAETSLMLELSADALAQDGEPERRLAGGRPGFRLAVAQAGRRVAGFTIPVGEGVRGRAIVLPRELVAGCDRLDLTFDVPRATSPARLGFADDDRRMGVFLREIVLRAPRRTALDEELFTGADGEEGIYLGGWAVAENAGRWTIGDRAQLLLAVDGESWPAEIEFDATPFIGRPGRRLLVEVSVNGARPSRVSCEREEPVTARVPIPAVPAPGRELLIDWRIRDPSSPHSHGLSEDRRILGLFLQRLVLRP
jgi:hypothetical protein